MRDSALVVACGCALMACDSFSDTPADPTTDGGADAIASSDGGAPTDGEAGATEGGLVRKPTILAPGPGLPLAVAADDNVVVWGDDSGKVRRVPLDGSGMPVTLDGSAGSPRQIQLFGNDVYWCDHTQDRKGLWRIRDGMAVEHLATSLPITSFAPFGSNLVTFRSSDNSMTLLSKDGAALNGVTFGSYTALWDIIADGSDVLWSDAATATIWRLKDGETTPTAFITNETDPRTLARNAGGIFFSRVENLIRMRDRSGGTSDVATTETGVHAMAADETGLYWLTNDSVRHWSPVTKTIETLASGFDTTTGIDPLNRSRMHKITLTTKYVVWLSATEVWRVEK